MEAIGLKVNRLIRISYGPFNIGNLPKGAAQEVKTGILKQQIKGFFKDEKTGKKPADKNKE
jgi:23S rRNA pseudouridine2605 synthase